MKKILILILTVCSIEGYGQTIMNPSGSNSPANINNAISLSATASGTDTYTATIIGATYTTNKAYTFTFTNACTGTPTPSLNINDGTNSLGAITLKKYSSGSLVNLASGDISAGQSIRFRYNGTNFVMEGGSGSGGGSTAFWPTAGTKALTGDVIITGATGTHSVSIGSGTDNINDFNLNTDGNTNITSNAAFINTTGIADITSSTQSSLHSGTFGFGLYSGSGIQMTLGSDATGDMFSRSSAGYFERIAPNSTATKKFLNQTSSGTPNWAILASGDIPNNAANTTGSAAKWTTARNLAGNSVDGSANVAFSNKFIVQGTTDAGLSGAQFLGALSTGIVKNTTTTGVLSIASGGTDYEFPLTFSTGLTRSTNTITVNTSQNISTLSNLTTNGFVTTSGGTGALSITVPGSGVSTWITTPSSSNLASALTDETGSGNAVFSASPAFSGTLTYGTLGYSDTDIAFSFQKSVNSYFQTIFQNTNSGATASTDIVISSDNGTATTHYLNLGKNSSGFTGSGSFNAAGYSYLTSTTDDLAIGTTTNNGIHFVVNNGATDAISITGAGAYTFNGTTTAIHKEIFPSLGTTQTDGAGLWLQNSTSASAGAQQISPSIVLEGQGWKTATTASSQTTKFFIDVLPVQGVNNPTAQLRFKNSINGGAYGNSGYVDSNGTFSSPASTGNLAFNISAVSSTSGFGVNNSSQGIIAVLSNAANGFEVGGSIGNTITARLDVRGSTVTGGTFTTLNITDNTNTAASNEVIQHLFTGQVAHTWNTNTYANQRFTYFTNQGLKAAASNSPIFTRPVNLSIQGAPITGDAAVTTTNTIGLEVESVNVQTAGTATNSYGAIINAQTGATNNYAASFIGGSVGIGTSSPVSSSDISGSIGMAITTVTANTTLDATHHTILADATSGNITITLPTASGATRREYIIKKIDSSVNTVAFVTAEGTTTLAVQWNGKQIQSNGSNYYITGSF
jgi:hypothetical protein